ncbi:ECF-type sigma factor [Neorhodopirellula pilleata]|uniref:ECF-type sigma factor n=1 Tax=Neorhodopirellula pilleata TaxID=2714738 RepID=UPI0011B53526
MGPHGSKRLVQLMNRANGPENRMQHEQVGQVPQATTLIHEAFLRLDGSEQRTWRNRRHFLGLAALAKQRILFEQVPRINLSCPT